MAVAKATLEWMPKRIPKPMARNIHRVRKQSRTGSLTATDLPWSNVSCPFRYVLYPFMCIKTYREGKKIPYGLPLLFFSYNLDPNSPLSKLGSEDRYSIR